MTPVTQDTLTADLKAHARGVGADLVGIAPVERFNEVDAQHHPASIFPEVQSVIVIGKRITRGALRGVEEGTQFDLYKMYGRDWLNNRVLATATFKTAEFLEDLGWEAVPMPNLPPEVPAMGVPVREGQAAPNVMMDFDDAAIRAGLGEMGYCGVLLTPRFGPRQRVQVVLTDAVLTPDALLEEPVCTRCREHASFCPLGAIHPENERTLTVCGKGMVVAEIDYARCKTCKNGAFPNALHSAGTPDRLAAICTRSCMQFLEQEERVRNTFTNSFRKREPWGIIDEQRML